MKFVILMWWLVASAVRADGVKDDVYVDGVSHQTEVLYNLSSESWLYSLAVDYKYNDLYLIDSYGGLSTAPVILNLNTKEHKSYLGKIQYARSLTVDQETHDLYIGNIRGIYKYKPSSGEEQPVGAADDVICHVSFKRVLYYTEYWSHRISTLSNGQSDKLVNMQYEVDRFIIDDEDVMFFSNRTGLYSRQMDSDHTTLYYKDSKVSNLAMNRNDNVYFTSEEGIYEIIKSNASYRRLVSVKEAKAITFDNNNNMIFCNRKSVYRLKPIAEVNITNNPSVLHEPNIDVTNNTNTINIKKQEETKLDVMDKKIDELITDHVEILKRIDRKNKDLSQKIDKLETGQENILKSVKNIYKLITDIVERNQELESTDRPADEPVTGQVYEQVYYSASFPGKTILVTSP